MATLKDSGLSGPLKGGVVLDLNSYFNRSSGSNCSQSSKGRHCLTDSTREITRPWLREIGKRAKRDEEQFLREPRNSFLREQCIIVGFRLRIMTLQQISSNHAPCKSRSTRHLPSSWLSQRVRDHRRALVGGYLGKRGH
jgi:hypothetical protein